jgi:hypothetical protein
MLPHQPICRPILHRSRSCVKPFYGPGPGIMRRSDITTANAHESTWLWAGRKKIIGFSLEGAHTRKKRRARTPTAPLRLAGALMSLKPSNGMPAEPSEWLRTTPVSGHPGVCAHESRSRHVFSDVDRYRFRARCSQATIRPSGTVHAKDWCTANLLLRCGRRAFSFFCRGT